MEVIPVFGILTADLTELVLCTFLHHSDPTIPHYRKSEWTFLRGVTATVDRPVLGWMGRFFFHNVMFTLPASSDTGSEGLHLVGFT